MSAKKVSTGEADERVGFTVDTHLFRELGELLVGRESTALIELVKNAYDADATEVTVYGESLSDPRRGRIRIIDDGVGMDLGTFQRGFLRIASRSRDEGTRRSLGYNRRYTGAKGVGRLSAHKLASRLDVTSHTGHGSAIDAHIDWDLVERAEVLADVSPEAVKVVEVRSRLAQGTIIELSRLKTKWSKTRLTHFVQEVQALQAPVSLSGPIPKSVVSGKTLFRNATVADTDGTDPGFVVKLEGDFDTGDSYESAILETAHWILEIDAAKAGVRYAIHPTESAKRDPKIAPNASSMFFETAHPAPNDGPFFHARIAVRAGPAKGSKELSGSGSKRMGVRVYLEGFRILPFGETSDDWLGLNRDAATRGRGLSYLDELQIKSEFTTIDPKEGLSLLPNKHYFGAIFLTSQGSPGLKVLVTREGLVPNESYDHLVTMVRRGIDLLTRVRATLSPPRSPKPGNLDLSSSTESDQPGKHTPSLSRDTRSALDVLDQQSQVLKRLVEEAPSALRPHLEAVAVQVKTATSEARETIPANSLIRILASVGTQLAAFTHEVNRLLAMANELAALVELRRSKSKSESEARALASIQRSVSELRIAIERQAAYLSDVVTPDARRRRSAQPLGEVFDVAARLLTSTAQRRGIAIENAIPPELKSPPMFRAELVAVFTNVLTNALKAAGADGRVRADGHVAADATTTVRLENTGHEVDLRESERWFKPFESTTTDVDPVLGQGMGLGLTITRDILVEAGGDIRFVRPSRGFATAVEITLRRTSR